MLSLAGAIVDNPHVGAHFDFEKLRDFMLATPDLVDESFWDELFGVGDDSSRMLALLVATLDRRAGDARRAEHGRPEDRAARAAADGRDALVAGMDCTARAQLRLDPDHAAAASSTTSTATSRSQTGPTCAAGSTPSSRSASCSARSAGRRAAAPSPTSRPGCSRASTPSATRLRTSSNYIAEVEPGVRARARLRRRQRNVERRHRAAHAITRPGHQERGDDLDQARHTGRRAGHRLRAALRHAHRRARRQRRAASARAGRAERRGDRDDRRARPGDHQPLVPLTRREGIATARGTAVRRRPRGAADRGRRASASRPTARWPRASTSARSSS